jgi:hypothetical protein
MTEPQMGVRRAIGGALLGLAIYELAFCWPVVNPPPPEYLDVLPAIIFAVVGASLGVAVEFYKRSVARNQPPAA